MKEEITRAEVQAFVWVIGALIFSNLGAVIGLIRWPIRNHLRRIKKIETDLNSAHAKIRDLQKPDCSTVECPLKRR
jgi:hypothetical protein